MFPIWLKQMPRDRFPVEIKSGNIEEKSERPLVTTWVLIKTTQGQKRFNTLSFGVNARELGLLFCIVKNFSVRVIPTMYFSVFYRSHRDFSLLKLTFQMDELCKVNACLHTSKLSF